MVTRTIQLPTDVFAAIWADRQEGEDTEAEIIARKFGLVRKNAGRDMNTTIGFQDPRYGVKLEAGFTVFRTFKGNQYTAQAIQGLWVSSHDGKGYPSLNELSIAIGAGGENAWDGWRFRDPTTGKPRRMSDLRDPATIRKKSS
jgi:hypothetical protein